VSAYAAPREKNLVRAFGVRDETPVRLVDALQRGADKIRRFAPSGDKLIVASAFTPRPDAAPLEPTALHAGRCTTREEAPLS
jgi:hypothetical protein